MTEKKRNFNSFFCKNWEDARKLLVTWEEVADKWLIKTFIRGVIKGGDNLKKRICS